MNEKLMQDLLKAFPSELIEDGLKYVDREIGTGNRRLDLVFLDKQNRLLLVEVQKGSLDTQHIDRHIDFVEGFAENNPDVDLRLMYIANRIDPLRKSFLGRRGYEFLEIPTHKFIALAEKNNMVLKNEIIENTDYKKSPQIKREMSINKDENQKRQELISRAGTMKEKEFWKLFFKEINKRPFVEANFRAAEFGVYVTNKNHFSSSGGKYSLMFTRNNLFKMNSMAYQGQYFDDGLARLKNWCVTPNLPENFYTKLLSNKFLDGEMINVPSLLNINSPEQLNEKLFSCIDLFR
jgi:hypothetical protein